MAGVYVKENEAALTVDGDATGYATVADNALFPIGSQLFIASSDVDSQLCQVTSWSGTTKVGLRFIDQDGRLNPPQYGVKSDLSNYLVADGAKLAIWAQVVDEYNVYKNL